MKKTFCNLLCVVSLCSILLALPPGDVEGTQEESSPPAFHHVHLNSIDPQAAIEFYTKSFDVTKKVRLAGWDGVQSEKMYLLFNKAARPPAAALDSAIWHFGWGSSSMEADYQKHLDAGRVFATPLTRLGSGLLFAYLKAPDGALVEINTSSTRAFIHTHLFSAAPICAAEWYVKHLGATSRLRQAAACQIPFAAPSEPLGVIRSPSATVRFGDVSLIIYPQQRPGTLVSPRGRVIDHIALGVTNLNARLESLRKAGVKILEEPHAFGDSSLRAAMIEGPDAIAIELVETQ